MSLLRTLLLACLLAGCAGEDRLSRPSFLTNVRDTERFVVHSDLAIGDLDHFVRWLDGFWSWFETHYYEVPPGRQLWVWLFQDQQRFEEWLRSSGRQSASGFYCVGDDGQGVLVVNLASGLGTATHELVHHFVRQAFGERVPPWLNEGFAAFFEKFLGHVGDDGRLHLSVGYFSNWRFPIAKQDVESYSLRQLFAAGYDVDQCAARSLVLFLHRQQKLRPLLAAMWTRTDDPDGSATLARAWGAPLEDLEARWKGWIRQQPLDADVALVPQSLLLTEAGWRSWWQQNEARLRWSEEAQRYVPR